MNIDDFICKIAEQFDDVKVATLTSETKFRELPGWCSIIALSIIAMVDEEYEVTLSGEELRAAQTIQELFAVVQSKKGI